jgi:hypothetical protein
VLELFIWLALTSAVWGVIMRNLDSFTLGDIWILLALPNSLLEVADCNKFSGLFSAENDIALCSRRPKTLAFSLFYLLRPQLATFELLRIGFAAFCIL